ncbi:MAG: DUF2007 domain-containing protein [Candidatus Cloacimonadales bacterium]
MYCPKCRAEYVAGKTECPDCHVKLVENLPPEDEVIYKDFVTVYETADPGLIALAESLLRAENIHFSKKSEGLQTIYAIGVVKFQVAEEDRERAFSLLQDLEESGDDESEE